MKFKIREHKMGTSVGDFLKVYQKVYSDDPAAITPLEMDLRQRIDPRKNPYFEHAKATLFIAYDENNEPVARCCAHIDRNHLEKHQDDTGFFGFFESINDSQVASALLLEAEKWLRACGMKKMRGPYSFTIYEESGVLVEGFEHPPVIMMPHARPYAAQLLEDAGFHGIKDFFSWRYEVGDIPTVAEQALEAMKSLPEVRFRSLNKKRMKKEVQIVTDIFNDTMGLNWGHVPSTQAEIDRAARDLSLVLDGKLAFFVEIENKPVAMCIAVPNINEAIADLNGQLFPIGLFKLLWRLKVKGLTSARLIALGIRQELRHIDRYRLLAIAMCAEIAMRGKREGIKWGELSWTLEDNHRVNAVIRKMGGKLYKRYRVFEKEI